MIKGGFRERVDLDQNLRETIKFLFAIKRVILLKRVMRGITRKIIVKTTVMFL